MTNERYHGMTETETKPMMACGHRSNASGSKVVDGVRVEFKHTCAICDCFDVADSSPDLTGRKARCSYYGKSVRGRICTGEADSTKPGIAFFEHRPTETYDRFYCGCFGWD